MIIVESPLTKDKLQQTIDAAAATGDEIVLPAGHLVLPSAAETITLKPGVTLRGSGMNSTVIHAGTGGMALVKFDRPAAGSNTGFALSNMTLSAGEHSNVAGLRIHGRDGSNRCSEVFVEDVKVLNCNKAIDVRFCANIFISEVFMSGGVDGIHIEKCTDVDIISGKAQHGSGRGIVLIGGLVHGSPADRAADEGIRVVGFSTNGQKIGLEASTQDWVVISNCSFTTAVNGAVEVKGACTNWKVTGSEFSVAGDTPNKSGFNMGKECKFFTFTGNQFIKNSFGMVLRGEKHTFVGNILHANSNVDIILAGARRCVVSGNLADSSGVSSSIHETEQATFNNISNNLTFGTIVAVESERLNFLASNHRFANETV